MRPEVLRETERLTLGVLMCGVASLSLSDFVSPVYWCVVVAVAVFRLWRGTVFALTEMQASLIGWAGFFWVGLELFLGRDFLVAFTDFLLILSLAVVIEAATPRNHLHRLITGQFLVLAAAVLTDSVLYAVPLAAFTVLMWRASRRLYGVNLAGGDLALGSWRQDIWLAVVMFTATAVLFVLLPRVGFGTAFQNVQRQLATSGFSDQVQFGDFARALDPTVIMRVEAGTGVDADEFRRSIMSRYWRGVALSRFTGTGWLQEQERQLAVWDTHDDALLTDSKKGLSITVYREAMDNAYLFVPNGLTQARDIPSRLGLTATGSLKFTGKPQHRLRLDMQLGSPLQEHEYLPPGRWDYAPAASKEITAWARQMSAGEGEPAARLEKIARALRSWDYDLNAPIDSARPVESFVLHTRRGHCELFASALTLAARSLGVPARIVNGYYGGDWNDVGKFLLIRQQHAHSWVEAWLDGRWQRLDPTPPVRWQMSGVRFQALDTLWESVKLAWYRYVLEFQNQDRAALLVLLTRWMREYTGWILVLLVSVALGWTGGGRLRLLWHHHSSAWSVIDRWLRQRGIVRFPYQPLRSLPPPPGISTGSWERFVTGWEKQAFDITPGWSRWQLMRHLRALSLTRC